MTDPPAQRYSLRWTRGNLAALLLLGMVAAGLAAYHHVDRPLKTGRDVPVDAQRVAAAAERINPNTAPLASLLRLPGIGPGRARAIIAHRQAPGREPFRAAEDLAAVRGIGPSTVRLVSPLLTFEGPPASRPGGP